MTVKRSAASRRSLNEKDRDRYISLVRSNKIERTADMRQFLLANGMHEAVHESLLDPFSLPEATAGVAHTSFACVEDMLPSQLPLTWRSRDRTEHVIERLKRSAVSHIDVVGNMA